MSDVWKFLAVKEPVFSALYRPHEQNSMEEELKMTKEFQFLIRLIVAGSRGERLEKPEYEVDWLTVEKLAQEQMAVALVGYALKLSPSIGCPEDIKKRIVLATRQTVVLNFTKKMSVVELLGRMEAARIHVALLKGFEAATCYASPECRGSADTDILIAPKDEKKACAFLKKEGFKVEPRWEHGHHAVATHPELGIVELHVNLYDEIIDEIWFGKKSATGYIQESHRLVRTEIGDYYSLGYTDKLIFLALHTIKHFIESGMSIRMMLDVALWIVNRASVLDMNRFWQVMTELKYDQLMNCILYALIRYGKFKESDFPGIGNENEQQVDMILADLEKGGWMGMRNKSERETGWYEYNRKKMLQSMKPWQYKLYMIKWQADTIKTAAFPSKETMIQKYPYLRSRQYLLPVAWMHRLIFRGYNAVHNGVLTRQVVKDESDLTQIGKMCAEMFRKLGMM